MSTLINELSLRPWNSMLQLLVGGIAVFIFAMFAGSYYGCGPGNSEVGAGVFTCQSGVMSPLYKFLIVLCIAFSSTCWGRAVSLLEARPVGE